MSKIFSYLKEVKTELFKVVWPTRKEALKMTFVVVIFSVLVALFLGAVDLGLNKLIEVIIS